MLDGDPSWLVKSIKLNWTSDRKQMAEYEIIKPFPGQWFIGHDGREKIKKSHRNSITKHSGMPHSASHSNKTLPAHKHSQHHRLSVAGPISSIQNPDGSFITFPAWNTQDGSDG